MIDLAAGIATLTWNSAQQLSLAGSWTARGLGRIDRQIDALARPAAVPLIIDASAVAACDSAGAWVIHRLLQRLGGAAAGVELRDLHPEFSHLLSLVGQEIARQAALPKPVAGQLASPLAALGRNTAQGLEQATALLAFIGECAIAVGGWLLHPARIRWRPILYNIRSAGFDALPIVGALSFLLGIVVAYQGAGQLRQYGANIFVADLVGLSMLREFAPLITAIIVAGRSGSAYAAQIGTMAVTEEIDAMRTLGLPPLDVLVLPKFFALLLALPLLTVFADVLGVGGGMIMAHAQLGVSYGEFLDRFVRTVSLGTLLIGIGKAPVFAAIIVTVGCFQGLRTQGGADSVGRQTTRSVVQSIFMIIVADGLFSIVFSVLDL